jgi:hypothetical protein
VKRQGKKAETELTTLPQISHSRHPSPPARLFFVRLGTGTGAGRAAEGRARARLPPALPVRPDPLREEGRPRPWAEPLGREEPIWG